MCALDEEDRQSLRDAQTEQYEREIEEARLEFKRDADERRRNFLDSIRSEALTDDEVNARWEDAEAAAESEAMAAFEERWAKIEAQLTADWLQNHRRA